MQPSRGSSFIYGLVVLSLLTIYAPPVVAFQSQPAAPQSDTTVRQAGAPVNAGIGTIRELLSIGKAEGPDEYLIVSLQDLALGPDGSIFVADRGVAGGNNLGPLASIRQYDSTGKFIRKIGRAGQGPGEFRAFSGMRVLPDGRLVTYDGSAGRVNVYARSGELTTSWPAVTGIGSTGFALSANGDSYIRVRIGTTTPGVPQPSAFVHYNIRGEIIDTVFEPPRPELPNSRMSITQGRGTTNISVPFMGSFTHWFSPLGYYVAARTDRYAIDLYQPTRTGNTVTPWKPGAPITSIRRNAQPVPVTTEERTLWRTSIEERARRTQPGWSWTGPDIPRVKPHFLTLMVDLDGRIWARVIDPAEKITPDLDLDDAAINLWDVFEPAGRYVGRVRTGVGVLPTYVKGDRILTYARDSNDVQRVVVGRIAW